MTETPLAANLHGEAEALRERFEIIRRHTVARQRIEALIGEGKLREATTVASALSGPLPMHQVVRVDFARGRS
jgi:hypothetical protein